MPYQGRRKRGYLLFRPCPIGAMLLSGEGNSPYALMRLENEMRSRDEPWKSFAAWLVASRGLGPASVSTYLTQTRRILAAVPDLSTHAVTAWIDVLPSHHRSPHRTAYRAYAEWRATVGEPVATLPVAEPMVTLPDAVVDALAYLQERSGLGSRGLAAMRWGARVEGAKAVAFPEHYFFLAPPEIRADYAVLPRAQVDIVTAWAYPNGSPGPDAPLIPRAPEERHALPATAISRIIRERRRAGGASSLDD